MSESREHKRRYNARLEYIASWEKWLKSEPPMWQFWRWHQWRRNRPEFRTFYDG